MKRIILAAMAAGFIGGTFAPAAVQAAGELFGSALVLTRTTATAFKFWSRDGVDTIPVPSVQPITNNRTIAFDVFPKGQPSERPDAGYAWADICDTDLVAQTSAVCARIGARSDAMEFGSRGVGGAEPKPLWLTMQGVPALTVEVDGSVSIGVLNLSGGSSEAARRCNRRTEGQVYYQKSTKRFLGCDGADWRRLN